MADVSVSSNHFEMRRQARSSEPQARPKSWKRRALMPTAVFLVVTALALGGWINYRLNHVWTVRASVCGALVNISSDIDAHLKELYVRTGQTVAKGQELARLDDTELLAVLRAAEASKAIRESAYSQARANRRLTEEQINAEVELGRARVEAAAARLANDEAELELRKSRMAEEIHRAEAAFAETDARLALLKKGPRKEIIDAARERLHSAKALTVLYKLEVNHSERLYAEGIIPDYTLQEKRTRLSTQKNRGREAELELARILAGATDEEIEIASQALAGRRASLALARTATEQIKAMAVGLRIRRAEVREAEAQLKRSEARQAEIILADERVKAAAAELNRAEAEVNARQAILDRMILRSPVAGTVIRTFVEVGELCRKGIVCVQITDNSEGRWVEGFVVERDAPLLTVGQPARVEIVIGSGVEVDAEVEAIGMATSSVDHIGSEGAAAPQPTSAEQVWVKLRPVEQLADSPKPGMSAQAVIRVR